MPPLESPLLLPDDIEVMKDRFPLHVATGMGRHRYPWSFTRISHGGLLQDPTRKQAVPFTPWIADLGDFGSKVLSASGGY